MRTVAILAAITLVATIAVNSIGCKKQPTTTSQGREMGTDEGGGGVRRDITFEFDPGDLADYFLIRSDEEQPSIAQINERTATGEILKVDRFTCLVEAKTTFMTMFFMGHFLDSKGVEVRRYPVVFDPDYGVLGWQPGQRCRMMIVLPPDLSRIKTLRIETL